MTDKQRVRGLLDLPSSDFFGEGWDLAEPSPEFVPGMGLGATEQARRWAWLGMQAETAAEIKRALRRPPHRPRKDQLSTTDAIRAYSLWRICHRLRHQWGKPRARIEVTNRELIRWHREIETALEVPKHKQLFAKPDQTIEPSVSKGRGILQIDDHWNSAVCEEVEARFSQTT